MRADRPSETALKVALAMVTLARKPGWQEKLPDDIAQLSEQLVLSAGATGYNQTLMAISKKRWMVGFYERYERIMPGIFEGLGERKIFINHQVRAALEQGFEQVLVVGAGFDTLCLRLAPLYPDAVFFEIDHPATGKAKARGVAELDKPDNMHLLIADLATTKISGVLANEQFWNSGKRTIVVLEGLLYYLHPSDVLDLFIEIGKISGERSQIAFSHMLDHYQHSWVLPLLRLIGEPWISSASVAELPNYIGTSWKVIVTKPVAGGKQFEGLALAEKQVSSSGHG